MNCVCNCVCILAAVAALLAMAPARAVELPDAIRQAGALKLTINATYAPMAYRDPAVDRALTNAATQ